MNEFNNNNILPIYLFIYLLDLLFMYSIIYLFLRSIDIRDYGIIFYVMLSALFSTSWNTALNI